MKSTTARSVRMKPFELLLSQEQIRRRIEELGRQISLDYAGESPVMVGVLKGCVVFIADLIRAVKLPVQVEFVTASSFRSGVRRPEDIAFVGGFSTPVKDRHVLLVEGIVDSGRTATLVIDKLRHMEPASIEIVTLLDKPGSHRHPIVPKYTGFSIGNDFVIGFGLDNTQQYRNLPFIGRLIDQ